MKAIISDRKSSKKLGRGPKIGGKKTSPGEARIGHSVPVKVLHDKQHEYGVSSYHGGKHYELREILSNQFVKDSMIEDVVKQAALKVNNDRNEEKDWRNNAYNRRSESI